MGPVRAVVEDVQEREEVGGLICCSSETMKGNGKRKKDNGKHDFIDRCQGWLGQCMP